MTNFNLGNFISGAFLGIICYTLIKDVYHRIKLIKRKKNSKESIESLLKQDKYFDLSLELVKKFNVNKIYFTLRYQEVCCFCELFSLLLMFFLVLFCTWVYW